MSKLYKFRPYLHMDEAAAYLEQLISEEVAEEDIYSLFIMGKINAYIGGNLVGLPVSPPTAETEFDGPWQFITNECLTKCDFFTKALSYPYQVCETSMGQTLLNMVDGVPYAWFKITEGYNPSSGPARNSNNLEPINTDDDLVVLPSDILSIANEANNVSQLPTDKEQADDTVVWFFDEEGKKVTRKPQRLAKSVKVQSPTEQPRVIDSPSTPLAVAALLELLSIKGGSALNQSAVIAKILDLYPTRRGLSKRNLEAIFATAKKAASHSER